MNTLFPVTARAWLVLIHDVFASLLAWYAAHGLFFNLKLPDHLAVGVAEGAYWVVPLQTGVFLLVGLHRDVWRHAGVPDLLRLLIATLLAVLVLVVPLAVAGMSMPMAILPLDALLLLVFLGAGRLLRFAWPQPATSRRRPALLVGGGQAGGLLRMLAVMAPELRVVGLLDSDPARQGSRTHGVPVLGRIDELVAVAAGKRVHDVLLYMPAIPPLMRESLARDCETAQICLHRFPALHDGRGAEHGLPIEVGSVACGGAQAGPADLIPSEVQAFLQSRVVLVIGTGGPADGELCRLIGQCQPARLVLFDANEQSLLGLRQELTVRFPDLSIICLLGQVMDRSRVDQVMWDYAPSLVLHAANYRQSVPEQDNTFQTLKYNVLGTWAVAKAARSAGVEKFVLLSGEGEGVPGSVVAASQRLAEMLGLALHTHALASSVRARKTGFITVRLGDAPDACCAGSLSDFGITGCKPTATAPFPPVSCPREQPCGGESDEKWARRGQFSLSEPKVRQAARDAALQVLRAAVMGQGGERYVLDQCCGENADEVGLRLLPSREVDADTMALMLDWLSHSEVSEDAEVHERLAAWLPGSLSELGLR